MCKTFPIFSLLVPFLSLPLLAEKTTLAESEVVANHHLQRQKQVWIKDLCSGQALPASRDLQIAGSRIIFDDQTGEMLAYIHDLKPEGFIAVSTDTNLPPIIAYSYKGHFSTSQDEENVLYSILRLDMKLRLEGIPFTDELIKQQNKESWKGYLGAELLSLATTQNISQWPFDRDEGWLETEWGQRAPSWNSCPLDPINHQRCVTGCLATAMGQIINYWKYPPSATFADVSPLDRDGDNYSSKYDPAGPEPERRIYIDVVPEEGAPPPGEYQYDLKTPMRSIAYDGTATSVADLLFACGVSVHMGYSSLESGGVLTEAVAAALKNKWQYSSADLKSAMYSDFYPTLQDNMKNGWPSQLDIGGYSSTGEPQRRAMDPQAGQASPRG